MGLRGISVALLALPMAGALQAQPIEGEPSMRHFTEDEIAAVAMPALAFEPSAEDADNYEKYFYFHRPETSFDEAYADLRECDALSSGLGYYVGNNEPYPGYYASQYGVGGVLGSALGAVLADVIHGSAKRRKARRINMRNCMSFKGYARYGLPKALWSEFNFEEGNGRKPEEEREASLLMQARAASGPRPLAEAIEA